MLINEYKKIGPVLGSYESESGIEIYHIDNVLDNSGYIITRGVSDLDLSDSKGIKFPFKIELIFPFEGSDESYSFSVMNYLLNKLVTEKICYPPGSILKVFDSSSMFLFMCHPFFIEKELQVFDISIGRVALLSGIIINNDDVDFIKEQGLDNFYNYLMSSDRKIELWKH